MQEVNAVRRKSQGRYVAETDYLILLHRDQVRMGILPVETVLQAISVYPDDVTSTNVFHSCGLRDDTSQLTHVKVANDSQISDIGC